MTVFWQDTSSPRQVTAYPRHRVESETWINDYREDGFVVFERLLPEDLINSHLESFGDLLKKFNVQERSAVEQLDGELKARFEEAVNAIYCDPDRSLRLCRYPVMHALASQLFDEESVAWSPLTMIWGAGAIPHRDLICFRDPVSAAARLWVALEDLQPDSGLLYVVPGTQKSGYRYNELLEEKPEFLEILRVLARGGTDAKGWSKLVKPILDHHHEESARIAESCPRHVLELNRGDAVLFDAALVHGSLVPANRNASRKSFLLEFRSRTCKTYSMRAYFGSKHDYRRPENAARETIIESPLGPYGQPALADTEAQSAPIVGFANSLM